jgi:hypothetical protein
MKPMTSFPVAALEVARQGEGRAGRGCLLPPLRLKVLPLLLRLVPQQSLEPGSYDRLCTRPLGYAQIFVNASALLSQSPPLHSTIHNDNHEDHVIQNVEVEECLTFPEVHGESLGSEK